MQKKLNNFLLQHGKLTLLFALIISSFIIWLRLRTRNPTISTSFVLLKFLIFSFLVIYCSYMVVKLLKELIRKKNVLSSKNFIIEYLEKIHKIILDFFLSIFEYTYNEYIATRWFKFRIIAKQIWVSLIFLHRSLKFFFIDLPGVVFFFSLFLDVVIYKEFYWFPKIAPILIIPLIMLVLTKSLKYETQLFVQELLESQQRYHPLTTDRDGLCMLWSERIKIFNELLEAQAIAEYEEQVCCQFFVPTIESQICNLIRYILFGISLGYQIYYMWEITIWQQLYANIEIFITHQNLTNPYILEIWLLLY